jgi:hypothetical protein
MKGINLRPTNKADEIANLRVIIGSVLVLGGRPGAVQTVEGGLVLDDTVGFVPPRITTTVRDAISSPTEGTLIFNTTTSKLQVYASATWTDLH